MGLFDKKYCDICGEKIGLLGNRKLDDGNLCKNCAAKLSPWFSERRSSTVAQIQEQLNYRENNKMAVAAFNTTSSYGQLKQLLIDEYNGKFMVANGRNYANENPDVLDLSQVTGVEVNIKESKSEEKYRDAQSGNMVSYNPPRYTYSYDWYCTIRVNHPYFDDMEFKLNNTSVKIDPNVQSNGYMNRMMGGAGMGNARMAAPAMPKSGINKTPANNGRVNLAAQINHGNQPVRQGQGAFGNIASGINNMMGVQNPQVMAQNDPTYQSFVQMGEEIKMKLRPSMYGNTYAQDTYAQQDLAQTIGAAFGVAQGIMNPQAPNMQQAYQSAPQAAPAAPVKKACPVCGAEDYPDSNGCCQYCGSPM